MKVAEKFISINGEGTKAGELAVFIRFKGCNLCCSYCDTMWANKSDTPFADESPEELASFVRKTGVRNVTLTGGEPLLQKDLGELIKLLADEGLQVEIETNGSVKLNDAFGSVRPVFTMDYKLPSSGCEDKMLVSNFDLLESDDTVKFVIGSFEDMERARKIIDRYDLISRCHVYFSPVFGAIEPEKIVDYMIDNYLNGVRLQIQMHKVIWDPDRRGV